MDVVLDEEVACGADGGGPCGGEVDEGAWSEGEGGGGDGGVEGAFAFEDGAVDGALGVDEERRREGLEVFGDGECGVDVAAGAAAGERDVVLEWDGCCAGGVVDGGACGGQA